jgi:hypothetical protein
MGGALHADDGGRADGCVLVIILIVEVGGSERTLV